MKKCVLLILQEVMDKKIHSTVDFSVQLCGLQLVVKTVQHNNIIMYDSMYVSFIYIPL